MPNSKTKQKKINQLNKLVNKSDSDSDESIHELSHYVNDRIKLMKEVIKVLKLKKIKSMAPDCLKDLNTEEMNSLLLEELLGISNKRLNRIFNGENVEAESSSTDEEEEKNTQQQPLDVISLDDISDSDDDILLANGTDKDETTSRTKNNQKKKTKKKRSIKSEKKGEDGLAKEKLMTVLELLELQARARAIRSQLALESEKKNEDAAGKSTSATVCKEEEDSDPEAVVIESPKNDEIVISSSGEEESGKNTDDAGEDNKGEEGEINEESEGMRESQSVVNAGEEVAKELMAKRQKIKLVREKMKKAKLVRNVVANEDQTKITPEIKDESLADTNTVKENSVKIMQKKNDLDQETDTIVIDLDESEINLGEPEVGNIDNN